MESSSLSTEAEFPAASSSTRESTRFVTYSQWTEPPDPVPLRYQSFWQRPNTLTLSLTRRGSMPPSLRSRTIPSSAHSRHFSEKVIHYLILKKIPRKPIVMRSCMIRNLIRT